MKSNLLAALALALPLSTQSAVIYRETFGIAPGAAVDSFATVFDWNRFDSFGQEITTTGTASGVNFTVNGRPIDVSNVNAGPNNDGTFGPYANGILYLAATPTPNMAFTPEFVVDPALYVSGSIIFSWYEGNNTAPHSFRLLIRSGGKWYASAETFTTPAVTLANFGTQSQLKTKVYDPTAANWLEINFDGDFVLGATPGTGVTTPSTLGEVSLLGAPPADLSGPITAFGVYGENLGGGTGNRRIDSFTIEATPLNVDPAKTLTWKGNLSADWDAATLNWLDGATARTFTDGDKVVFDDTASAFEVNLVAQVSPGLTTVSNQTKDFKFVGNGALGGLGALIKEGAATLTLANNNTFSGGLQIKAGKVQIGDGLTVKPIGNGPITNSATLEINGVGPITLAGPISGTGRLIVDGGASVRLTGVLTQEETIIRAGSLTLSGTSTQNLLNILHPEALLMGTGTNVGRVSISGLILPGDDTVNGTLTVGQTTFVQSARPGFNLTPNSTTGNDMLQVNGDITINDNTIHVILSDLPATGVPYKLISYTGQRSGAFNPLVQISGANRYTAQLVYDDANRAINVVFSPPAVPSQIIYRETFGVAPGTAADQFATVYDWDRFDEFGQEYVTGGSAAGVNFSADGRPTDAANVNAGPNHDGTTDPYVNGILYLPATGPNLAFTTEYTIDPSSYLPGSLEFSWYEGNNTTGHSFRLLVRVGGVWYASTAVFTTPAIALGSFGTQAEIKRLVFDPAAANWRKVNFDGNYTLGATPGTGFGTSSSLGEPSLLEAPQTNLTGPLTAFGVYGENLGGASGNRRIDSFTITAATAGQPGTTIRITSILREAATVRLQGDGGAPNATFKVLTSPTLAPIATWTQAATGAFDNTGNFNTTAPATSPQQFYVIQTP